MAFKYTPPSQETMDSRSTKPAGWDAIIKSPYRELKFKERPNKAYQFRILPPTWDDKIARVAWGLQFFLHSQIGADNQQYVCNTSLHHSQNCYLCNQSMERKRVGDKDGAYALKAQPRSVAWVIFREEEEKGPQPLIFTCSDKGLSETTIWKMSKDVMTNERMFIDHPEKGFDVFTTRVGSGPKNTSYTTVIAPRSTPLSNDPKKMEVWLDYIQANPLPTILNFFEDSYLEKVYNGKVEKKESEPQVQTRSEITSQVPVTTNVVETPTVSTPTAEPEAKPSFHRRG